MQSLARVLMITFGLVLLGPPASAVVLSLGEAVILVDNVLVRVDPVSGASEVIADAGRCSALAGSGGFPEGLAAEASGDLLLQVWTA